MLTCEEYDRSVNPISASEYIKSREPYFNRMKERILSDQQAKRWIFLPPYSIDEVEKFEQLNNISLPIQFKYYITHISRVFAKHHPAIFRIYDVDYFEDRWVEDFKLDSEFSNFPSRIPDYQNRYVYGLDKNHPIFKETEYSNEIDGNFYRYYIAMQNICHEKKYPMLKIPSLSKPPTCLPSKTDVYLESIMPALCDICNDSITNVYAYCDLCGFDICEKCSVDHPHRVETTICRVIEKKPYVKYPNTPCNLKKMYDEKRRLECEQYRNFISKFDRYWKYNKNDVDCVVYYNNDVARVDYSTKLHAIHLELIENAQQRGNKMHEKETLYDVYVTILHRKIKRLTYEGGSDSMDELQVLLNKAIRQRDLYEEQYYILQNREKYIGSNNYDRYFDGTVFVGEFGCGEVEYLFLNGQYKGHMAFLQSIEDELTPIYSRSLFYYLLYTDF